MARKKRMSRTWNKVDWSFASLESASYIINEARLIHMVPQYPENGRIIVGGAKVGLYNFKNCQKKTQRFVTTEHVLEYDKAQGEVRKFSFSVTMQGRKRTSKFGKYCAAALQYVRTYMKSSTFHGVHHITVTGNRHWSEALFWFFTMIIFVSGAVWTIFQSYERYLANPTVITLDKSYRTWNITFPASTICFVDKFDAAKAENLVKKKWNPKNGTYFDYYMRFLNVLSNSSYYNLASFEEFKNDEILLKENLFELMNEVNFEAKGLSPILFNKKILYYFKTILEMGFCYTVSSLLAGEFIPNERKRENVKIKFSYEPQYCEFLHASCYGMIEELPRETTVGSYFVSCFSVTQVQTRTTERVYVHSPYEIPIATSAYHTLYYSYHMELAYDEFEIKASSSVRQLNPDQRRCYFIDEPITESMKYYSFNGCIMECRKVLAMRWCGCIPHFYKAEEGQPICNVKQLSCIHKKSSDLLALSQKRNKTEKFCTCYPSCEDSYIVFDYESISKHDIIIEGKSVVSTRYRWAIEKYSTTRYRRDIIFGIEELIVSFGGTACFFLGGSLMSGIELIYFFSVRFIRYLK